MGLRASADYETWRNAARPLLNAGVPPHEVAWVKGEVADIFEGTQLPPPGPEVRNVPRRFHELVEEGAMHNDPARFAAFYRLAWRLQTTPALLDDRTDKDVNYLYALIHNVRRETHKMHAYVRFRKAKDGERYVAWHEPAHYIIRKAAPFFAERFANMNWAILTPVGSAHWDGETLAYGDPATREDCPPNDATEDDWRVYYESIFNPARLNMKAMLRHVPRRFWGTMPETQSVPRLVREAEERIAAMIDTAPTTMRKSLNRIEREAAPGTPELLGDDLPEIPSLEKLRSLLPECRRCELWRHATQVVGGEGPAQAEIVLVGEQPGDQEDLQGKPFIGPAGGILDKAIAEAGLDRSRLYITNAVKHFKYEMRGKRRLHQKPNAGEVGACNAWLKRELDLVQPRVTVALGATALGALMGPKATLKAYRGKVSRLATGGGIVATYHPSYILRIPDKAGQDAAYRALVDDLKLAAEPFDH